MQQYNENGSITSGSSGAGTGGNGAGGLNSATAGFGGIFTANGVAGAFSSHGSSTRTCPATDDIGDSCCICNDPFEIFWFAEKEEWHFKDALRVDNKLYHPICFEDAREVNNH